jgi:hypothetical protein
MRRNHEGTLHVTAGPGSSARPHLSACVASKIPLLLRRKAASAVQRAGGQGGVTDPSVRTTCVEGPAGGCCETYRVCDRAPTLTPNWNVTRFASLRVGVNTMPPGVSWMSPFFRYSTSPLPL